MTKTEAEKLHKFIGNKLIKQYGDKSLYNDEIHKIGKELFKSKFIGVFAQNASFPLKQGYYIINTDTKNNDGIHWVSMYLTKTKAYIYDSFGRKAKYILSHLVSKLTKNNYKIKNSDTTDREQRPFKNGKITEICGPLSLAWLYVVNKLGIRKALTV